MRARDVRGGRRTAARPPRRRVVVAVRARDGAARVRDALCRHVLRRPRCAAERAHGRARAGHRGRALMGQRGRPGETVRCVIVSASSPLPSLGLSGGCVCVPIRPHGFHAKGHPPSSSSTSSRAATPPRPPPLSDSSPRLQRRPPLPQATTRPARRATSCCSRTARRMARRTSARCRGSGAPGLCRATRGSPTGCPSPSRCSKRCRGTEVA